MMAPKDKIKIQIYEIQQAAEAEALIEMGVDHIGSVLLDAERWKQDALRDTVRLVADSPAKSSLIPLFSSADMISRALDFYQPYMVHFCETIVSGPGRRECLETVAAVQAVVRQRFPEMAMMRSVPIGLPSDPTGGQADAAEDVLADMVSVFAPISDWFLTDTVLPAPSGGGGAAQPVAGFIGITGQACDWALAARLVAMSDVPVIVAGGLSPDNVFAAIAQTRPAGVDSCTQTNQADGRGGFIRFKKDMDKVARFVSETRRAEAEG